MWNFKSAPKAIRIETGDDSICNICSETIGAARMDGSIEITNKSKQCGSSIQIWGVPAPFY